MAVTFTQQPTTPNGTQSTIVYGLNNLSSQPQAKYICDIVDNDTSTNLVRIKQPANNDGYGVFEISDILHDYIEWDEPWEITSITPTSTNAKVFSIQFGEEYGTSTSSSVDVYPNQINQTLTTYPAVTDPIDGFNWDSGSYYSTFLSNSPQTLYARPSDYGTLSKMNITDALVSSVLITVYNSSNQVITSKSFTNTTSTGTQSFRQLINIPAGPANFQNDATLSILSGTDWAYYTITTSPNRGNKIVYRLDDCIEENGTRFAFINRLGVWDYYTAELTKTENESYAQDTYEEPYVNFSTSNGSILPNRRGTTVYNKKITSTLGAQTNWLTTDEANWLSELFQSPNVYVQYNGGFIPVVITNTTMDKKTNPRGQKLFTYRFEYTFANPRKSRR